MQGSSPGPGSGFLLVDPSVVRPDPPTRSERARLATDPRRYPRSRSAPPRRSCVFSLASWPPGPVRTPGGLSRRSCTWSSATDVGRQGLRGPSGQRLGRLRGVPGTLRPPGGPVTPVTERLPRITDLHGVTVQVDRRLLASSGLQDPHEVAPAIGPRASDLSCCRDLRPDLEGLRSARGAGPPNAPSHARSNIDIVLFAPRSV